MAIKYLPQAKTPVMGIEAGYPIPENHEVHIFRGMFLAGLLTVFFGLLAEKIVLHHIYIFDDMTTHLIRQFINPELTAVMKVFTFLGSAEMQSLLAVGALTVLFLLRRPLTEKLFLTAAITGSTLLNELLKNIFHRPRPDVNQLIQETGYSFPSGHAMVGIAFFGAIAYLLWTFLPLRHTRWLMAAGFALVILAIGVSRVYLGVHYPSDIAGGYAAGGAWLTECIVFKRLIEHRNSKTCQEDSFLK